MFDGGECLLSLTRTSAQPVQAVGARSDARNPVGGRRQDELLKLGPPVLGMAARPEFRAAFTVEEQRGRIREHKA